MELKPGMDGQPETSDGGLKELVLRWFTGTQASVILHDGSFPDWFQGFAARKDAEDLLRDKALGCFLIRLSDKAVGYILSYKGHDRCRHFVISQNRDGMFVISGDCQTYGSLTELIEHYRTSPIQPFGEYLTSSCYEVSAGELYDVVRCNTTEKSGVSVQALRNLWDQKEDHRRSDAGANQRIQQQTDTAAPQPPALPPKSQNKKLTGTLSVDAMSAAQAGPPVPKRGIPLGLFLSGSLPDRTSQAQMDPNRPRGNPVSTSDSVSSTRTSSSAGPAPADPPGVAHSQLTSAESRSKSLPRLNGSEEEEGQHANVDTTASFSPTPLKRVTCHTYSLHDPRHTLGTSRSRPEQQEVQLQLSRCNPLYQSSEGHAARSDITYAEVLQRPAPDGLPDATYEQIPPEVARLHGNTYESLDDMKTKKSKSTWGKNNINWKKFLPDYKKK